MKLRKKDILKFSGLGSGFLFLVLSFQNCGQNLGQGFQLDPNSFQVNYASAGSGSNGSSADNIPTEVSTGDLCEDQLYAKFASGYYVFLRNNCASCHDGSHEAPAFASKNSLASYQVFKDKGYQLVSANAISETHNPPYTGTHNSGAISSLKTEWESAVTAWTQCQGSSVVDKSVLTAGKSNSAIVSNKANAGYWGALSWNLSTAADMPTNSAKFPLTISVDAQVAKVNGSEVGYAIRKPTMSVASGTAKYRVKGLFFSVNGKIQDSATVYRNIDAVLCPGDSPLNLAPVGNAQLLVLSKIATTDKFALQFSSIEKVDASEKCGIAETSTVVEDSTPSTVTFTQLVSTDPQLGVFKSQCLSCHAGAGASAGLDLSVYAQAKAKASSILTRINDSTNPMPRSGIMSSSQRAIIEKWVTLGAPQ